MARLALLHYHCVKVKVNNWNKKIYSCTHKQKYELERIGIIILISVLTGEVVQQ